jgi:hypothetical protein
MNHEGTFAERLEEIEHEGKKKNLFTRQLVLDRLLVMQKMIKLFQLTNLQ